MKTMTKMMSDMKNRLYIIALLSVMSAFINAQTDNTPSKDNNPFRSQQILAGGAHDGAVYEPFTDEVPSDACDPTIEGKYRNNKPGIRRDFDTPGEANQSEEYPIGDGVWAMLFCALAFAGVIALRRRAAKE